MVFDGIQTSVQTEFVPAQIVRITFRADLSLASGWVTCSAPTSNSALLPVGGSWTRDLGTGALEFTEGVGSLLVGLAADGVAEFVSDSELE